MSDDRDDDPALARALVRYRLIAEAAAAPHGLRTQLLRLAASKEVTWPDGRAVHVTVRTLQRWLARFHHGGFAALVKKPRKDKGKARAITAAALARIIALRTEGPDRSTPTLIDIVERTDEVAHGALKRSTVDRHLDRLSASRRMLHVLGTKRHVRLSFPRPLDFVVGDFHAGPYIRDATDAVRRTELSAFIDHCSRFVPESRYGLTEDLMHVRRGMRAFVVAHGAMHRLYVDGGPGYQAHRFHFGCAQLGIDLVHSKAYTSEGRGVIERFNRNVKYAFETEVALRTQPPTLDELNELWWAWLEERYHRVRHSEINELPRERWDRLYPQTEIRRKDPTLVDEVMRLHARRIVHPKTSTVEVCGVRFVVDTALRRRKVSVLYDPHDLSSVLVFLGDRRMERAVPQVPGEHPVEHTPAKRPPPSVDYLELLRRDHRRRRAADAAAIRFRAAPGGDDATLTLSVLVERLGVCCGRPLGDVEKQLAADALHALAPVERAIADTALRAATGSLGAGLHASQYLDALRAHVLALRQKGNPTS
jgi:transposase InsO family protein